jgi:anti-sigma regulatory factor (Ser/Thr protein kinase)
MPFREPRPGEIVLQTSPRMLQDLFTQLRPLLLPSEQDGFDTSRVYLLLDELLSNAHRHGYSNRDGEPIGVRIRLQGDRVHLAIRDRAPTFDCAAHAVTRTAPPPDVGATGGMGLYIVQSMCESFVHRVPLEGGNALYVVMRMPRRAGAERGDGKARRAPQGQES